LVRKRKPRYQLHGCVVPVFQANNEDKKDEERRRRIGRMKRDSGVSDEAKFRRS